MTPEEIAELERLCAEATPGPWQTRFVYRLFRHARKDPDLLMQSDVSADWPDADFIAAARTALPKLLVERREREAKLAEMERERDVDFVERVHASAEAKLARVRELSALWKAQRPNIVVSEADCMALRTCAFQVDEALADPPRTTGGTDHA